MKQKLGKFEIIEPLDDDGSARMYRGVEQLGEGFHRPAAIKILPNFKLDDEQVMRDLRQEVELLVELSSCPNIVTVYGLGIDEEVGAWIAMELSGRSLKHFIRNAPAEPDQLRVLLRDTLRALAVVHGAEPQIIHRDLKPANIFCSSFGTWQIGDFGLATRRLEGDDDTLDVMTVQYAAPEMLDATLGQVSPRSDLYSVGMVAYEYALGRELYRKQFPSIYDPYADDTGSSRDDRPKWMYWHTSPQMTVPPIAEIIDDYPKDLSDLIASMVAKPIGERVGSADEALVALGDVVATAVPQQTEGAAAVEARAGGESKRTLLLAAVTLVLVVIVGGAMLLEFTNRTEIHLRDGGLYSGNTPQIAVHGTIDNFPNEGSATISLRDGSTIPVYVDDDGGFSAQVKLPRLGEVAAQLTVVNRKGKQVAQRIVRLDRNAPDSVQVVLKTMPAASAAEVDFTSRTDPGEHVAKQTDKDGTARAEVPYGSFDLVVTHPRYKRLTGTSDTGIDPVKSMVAKLVPLSEARIAEKRRQLLNEMDRAADAVANGDAKASARVKQLSQQLAQLDAPVGGGADGQASAGGDPDSARRTALLEELDEVAAKAEAGDRGAAARIKAIDNELRELERPLAAVEGVEESVLATGGTPGGVAAGISRIDQVTLLGLSLADLKAFVKSNIPQGALRIEAVPEISKLRVAGPVFNQEELDRLIQRLAPAAPRLEFEVRIDPWGLARQLRQHLVESGAQDVGVYAYLVPGDNTLYVLFTRSDGVDVKSVTGLARPYVMDEDLLVVQGYLPDADQDATKPEAEEEAASPTT